MATVPHICLVGSALVGNPDLIRRLTPRNRVTLVSELERSDLDLIGIADVVAVDCGGGDVQRAHAAVSMLRGMVDRPIVVTDGGLDGAEVARLLGAGARDYFSSPLDVHLVAERLEHLASARLSAARNPGSHP